MKYLKLTIIKKDIFREHFENKYFLAPSQLEKNIPVQLSYEEIFRTLCLRLLKNPDPLMNPRSRFWLSTQVFYLSLSKQQIYLDGKNGIDKSFEKAMILWSVHHEFNFFLYIKRCNNVRMIIRNQIHITSFLDNYLLRVLKVS